MKNITFVVAILAVAASLLLLNSCSGGKEAIRVGDTVASFSGTDIEGRPFSLKNYMGNPVILRFFLIDCPYCKADTPVFNMFFKKYRQKGLEIVYINNNGKNVTEVKDFAREFNIEFPVIYDPEGEIAKEYNVKLQPLAMVLSPQHKLLAALLGGVSEAELHEILSKYVQ